MSTFCHVPGGWHGACCLSAPAQELEPLGHSAVAVELESDRPDERAGRFGSLARPVGCG